MKKVILLVSFVLAVGVAAYVTHRNSRAYKVAHGGIQLSLPVKCYACGKTWNMTFEEMNRFIKNGQAKDTPGQFKKFPCSSCGKLEASLYDGKYENAAPQH